MADAALKIATYADLLALGDGVHAEIVAGELVIHAAPGVAHGFSALGLGGDLLFAFQRGRGGPGGWWILGEVDVALPIGDVVRPDLAGWRITTMPTLPQTRPVEIRPDWICEVLSPSNAAYDEGEKLALYHAAGVEWVWHVDPERRLVRVYAYDPRGYIVSATIGGDTESASLAPFEAVPFCVRDWFPPRLA